MQKQDTLIPSTTPLEPAKSNAWKSAENLQKTENNEIDKEFEMFTKERAEIKNPLPLEPTVLVINMSKNNLGTVTEDEEKHEESKDKTEDTKEIDIQDKNPFKIPTDKEKNIDPLLNISSNAKNNGNEEPKSLDTIKKSADKPKNLDFNEITRKPNDNDKKETDKPFLRDRSASIGTLSLKTPLAHLIGEQNRTMLFQVCISIFQLYAVSRTYRAG